MLNRPILIVRDPVTLEVCFADLTEEELAEVLAMSEPEEGESE